jgi:protocatechuate 3,4-dioxygenase beta subunit
MIMRKNTLTLCIAGLCLALNSCSQAGNTSDNISGNTSDNAVTVEATTVNPTQENCTWCGTSEAPKNVSWKTAIPPQGESGEKLIISGTIYLPDGITPAPDIVVYVYHTNTKGVYPKKGDEKGNAQFHGYLRAWMKTDSTGRYEFETFRPAPYHSHGGEPAHIHYTIQGPKHPEYWLTALWFSDDPRVTEEHLTSVKRTGGFSNVTTLITDENDVLRGERNIILERFE